MSFSTVSSRTTFVLIPGAGTDPGACRWTIAELRARGHEAVASPLPLDDPEAGPVAHAAAVVDAARDLPGRLVVVGQSLGAFTAPLVAARMPVAELVLVAPMIPTPGETAGEWWSAVGHDRAIAPLVLHDVPAAIAQACERFNRAPGAGMFREPWPLSDWPNVRTRVLAPRDDCFRSPFSNASRASASDYRSTCCRVGTSRCSRAQGSWPPTWQLENIGPGGGDRATRPWRRRGSRVLDARRAGVGSRL
jgi:Alpha/beta hydrolase family